MSACLLLPFVICHYISHGAPTTSCSRQECPAKYILASTGSRSPPTMTLQHSNNPHPSKYSQTQSLVRSGIKRKIVDCEDLDFDHYKGSDHVRKKIRKCSAARSTCSSSSDSSHAPLGQSALRSSPAEQHQDSACSSSSSQTRSKAGSKMKRQEADDEDTRPRKKTSSRYDWKLDLK